MQQSDPNRQIRRADTGTDPGPPMLPHPESAPVSGCVRPSAGKMSDRSRSHMQIHAAWQQKCQRSAGRRPDVFAEGENCDARFFFWAVTHIFKNGMHIFHHFQCKAWLYLFIAVLGEHSNILVVFDLKLQFWVSCLIRLDKTRSSENFSYLLKD